MRIFSRIFKARDKPKDVLSGSRYSFLFGGTTAGKSVNEHTAMQMTAVYSCIRILSETLAGLPLHVYRYNDTGGKEKYLAHPLYRLLHDEPNPEMTSFAFRETLMSHLLLWGNAYSQIIRNAKGEVVALYPLMPNKMTVDRDSKGRLYYLYSRSGEDAPTLGKDSQVYLTPSDVLHIPGLAFDGLVGYSPIAMAKNAVGLAIVTEEYGAKFFANGAAPGGVLEHPGTLKDPQRIKDSWNAAYQGSGNAMQMFFENTEQYAGNFARESTQTISGSIGLLQAALSSFTAGLGNANADMTNLTQNLVDAFQAVVKNIVPVLENIVAALPTATGAILQAVADLLPILLETVTELFTQVLNTILTLLPELIPAAVDAVMTIVEALIDNLPLLLDAAVQLVTALARSIGSALPELIPAAVTAITTIVQGLVDNLPMLLDAALQLILGLAQGLLDAIPQLVAALPTIITGIVDFIIGSIPQIIDAGIQLLVSLVEALPEIITAIVAAIPQIIEGLITAILGSIPQLIDAGVKLLVALVQNLPQIITTVVSAIPEIVTSLVNAIVGNIDKIILAGVQLFVALIQNLPAIIVEVVKAVPQVIMGLIKAFSSYIGQMAQVGGSLIKGLWQGISDAGAWLWDKISGFFGGVVDKIKNFFGIHSPSTLFAGLGDNMAEGLGVGFEKTMAQVGEDMQNAIPASFDTPGLSVNATMDGISGVGGFGSSLITIQQMIVRSEDDIRRISQELYNLMQTGSRAQGRFSPA